MIEKRPDTKMRDTNTPDIDTHDTNMPDTAHSRFHKDCGMSHHH